MRRPRSSIAPLLLLPLLACGKPAPTTTPTDATTPTTTEPEPTPVATTEPAKTEAPPEDPEAKKKAEQEKQMADRLAQMEKQAEETKKRWTPELQAKVTELTSKKQTNTKKALQAILASEHRAPGNAERDKDRHPVEMLTFFGLKPNMKVFEIAQGAGWYTEILAPLLARDGKLYLAGYDAASTDPRTRFSARAMELFISSAGNLYEKVELVTQGPPTDPPNLGPESSLDMVIIFRMLHNIHRSKRWDAVMQSAHKALKPGGVLAIEQHRAPADADPDKSAETGYMPEKWVIEKIESYGFKLAKKSEINANPKDTKDHPEGVWTLPPTLALGDKDKDKYMAIGESDRSTLKFVKVAKK